jgi:sRNA-binding regulator protein Hfq
MDELEQLKNLTYVSIISADNYEFGLSEDDKQEIIYRHKLGSSWDYILEPIKNEKKRKQLIEFFEDNDESV